MDDSAILQRIGQLVDDEHHLYRKGEEDHGLSDDDEARLRGPRGDAGPVLGPASTAPGPARVRFESRRCKGP